MGLLRRLGGWLSWLGGETDLERGIGVKMALEKSGRCRGEWTGLRVDVHGVQAQTGVLLEQLEHTGFGATVSTGQREPKADARVSVLDATLSLLTSAFPDE